MPVAQGEEMSGVQEVRPEVPELSPEDKVFDCIENNILAYGQNRDGARAFIHSLLKDYSTAKNSELTSALQQKEKEQKLLKKGIILYNKKVESNESKAKNYDQLMNNYVNL